MRLCTGSAQCGQGLRNLSGSYFTARGLEPQHGSSSGNRASLNLGYSRPSLHVIGATARTRPGAVVGLAKGIPVHCTASTTDCHLDCASRTSKGGTPPAEKGGSRVRRDIARSHGGSPPTIKVSVSTGGKPGVRLGHHVANAGQSACAGRTARDDMSASRRHRPAP
jgi:hypothetical protein